MTELTCGVQECVNNSSGKCCLPDIAVGGPNASDAKQTFCADFSKVQSATNAVSNPNNNLSIRCEAKNCEYNSSGRCEADSVDIHSTAEAGWPEKTECATFSKRK